MQVRELRFMEYSDVQDDINCVLCVLYRHSATVYLH